MRFKEFNTQQQQQIPSVGPKDFRKLSPNIIQKTQDVNKLATQKATQGTKPTIASGPNQKIGQQTSLSQKPMGKPATTNPTIPKNLTLPTGNDMIPYNVDAKGNDIILTPVNKTPGSNKTISTKVSRQDFLATLAALQGNKTP